MQQKFNPNTVLKHLPNNPGIYQMYNALNEVLYVGKAKNLKKRVSSYFRGKQSLRIASLVNQIHHIETIITRTENEALLLESNLIKKLHPPFNILLRDDKSYPYLVLSEYQEYPRLNLYRGPKIGKNRYFGPYPSTSAVRETLNLLQKLFRLRSCEDTFFRNRTRPCLQYQIRRCTAPCVGFVNQEDYRQDVKRAVMFLEGKSQEIIEDLARQMEQASNDMEYEQAAHYRDLIASLRQVQQQQVITTEGGDVDVVALALARGSACVQVMTVRNGNLLGGKAFFPEVPKASTEEEILSAFLSQYYLQLNDGREIPRQIILSNKVSDQAWIEQALIEQAQHKIIITHKPRGERLKWLQIAMQNAKQALAVHLADRATVYQRLESLQALLGLGNMPQRLECFDISHTQGEATVASCVVFDEQGPRKTDYRRFNIENITPGDDYAAMQQALSRRYLGLKTDEGVFPDVLIIDGGKGQLTQAEKVLEELQISGITVLAIAKGPTRKAGFETLFLSGKEQPLQADPDSLALHLVQQIRDEAHRFAITGHRGRRAKARHTSVLETIPGIGAKRRRELLRQFGGLQELMRASSEDIAKVPGISKELAERIYTALQKI